MANDVIDSLENMKLTTDEEEIIPISNEGRLEAIESCNLSLIGKFLTCKPFNKRVVDTRPQLGTIAENSPPLSRPSFDHSSWRQLPRAWGPVGGPS